MNLIWPSYDVLLPARAVIDRYVWTHNGLHVGFLDRLIYVYITWPVVHSTFSMSRNIRTEIMFIIINQQKIMLFIIEKGGRQKGTSFIKYYAKLITKTTSELQS